MKRVPHEKKTHCRMRYAATLSLCAVPSLAAAAEEPNSLAIAQWQTEPTVQLDYAGIEDPVADAAQSAARGVTHA